MDKLENLYRVDDQVSLLKYDKNGIKLFEYSNPSFSGIYGVDVSDPYKVLLFYRDQQKVVFLDNTLSEISISDLTHSGNSYFSCLSRSIEGDLWAYEINSQKLLKLNEDMEILDESFPLYQEGLSNFSPDFIGVSMEDMVLGDPDSGVLLFDHFGNYQKKLPIVSFSMLKNLGTSLLYYKEQIFYQYDKAIFEEKALTENRDYATILFAIDEVNTQILFFKEGEILELYKKTGLE